MVCTSLRIRRKEKWYSVFNYPNKSLPDIIKDVRLAISHFCSKKDSKQFSYAIIDLALQICDNDNLSLKYLFSKIKERYDQ